MNLTKSVLIIGLVWPEPTSSAAGVRMLQLIDLFSDLNYRLVFSSASLKTERSARLHHKNVEEVFVALNDSSFDDFLKNLNPSIVVYDRYIVEEQFGWRVRENCPNALQILDTEDLHFLRNQRQFNHYKANFEINDFTHNTIALREIASIYRVDLSLIISEFEMDLLVSQFNISTEYLLYLPLLVSDLPTENNVVDFEERKDFVSIGNYRHPPNADAVKFVHTSIWPHIHSQLPNAILNIYGAYPNQHLLQLSKKSLNFYVNGEVENVDDIMKNARVGLAPLRFGAGLKGKVLDALKNGTPCIVTPVAAEGILDNTHYPVAKNEQEFIALAVSIYTDKMKWMELSQLGFEILKTKFSKSTYSEIFAQKIEGMNHNLIAMRSRNFIGNMLRHHTLQSTKYLSKWIEAKNKKPLS